MELEKSVDHITDDELMESKTICVAATPGPWRWAEPDIPMGGKEPAELSQRTTLESNPHLPLFEAGIRDEDDQIDSIVILRAENPLSTSDAAFISHAREMLPRALNEIERLKLKITQLENNA